MKLFSTYSSSCSISRVLRQLLCFNTTTTLPENTIIDFENTADGNVGANKKNNPGIVARLMGLESLPYTGVKTATNSTINYASPRQCNDESLVGNNVPSPVFVLEHDEEFIVISFEDERKGKNEVLLRSKSQRRRRRVKQSDGVNGKENLDPNKKGPSIDDDSSCQKLVSGSEIQELGEVVCSTQNLEFMTVGCEKHRHGRKYMKALDSTKIEEQYSDFENSSPVSVLDIVPFNTDPTVAAKSEAGSLTLGSSNQRWELSIEVRNYEESPSFQPGIHLEKNKLICNADSRQKHDSTDRFPQNLGKICKMAQRDVIESNGAYIQLWKLDDIKDISAEFELQIIGRLLDDLVDQLIDLSI